MFEPFWEITLHSETKGDCDRPTILPTVCVFSCHLLSHTLLAEHRFLSFTTSPLLSHATQQTGSGWWFLICNCGGPCRSDSVCIDIGQICRMTRNNTFRVVPSLKTHRFTVSALLCCRMPSRECVCVHMCMWGVSNISRSTLGISIVMRFSFQKEMSRLHCSRRTLHVF